jgi:hypothetical protein
MYGTSGKLGPFLKHRPSAWPGAGVVRLAVVRLAATDGYCSSGIRLNFS